MSYIGQAPGIGISSRFTYTATSGDTTITQSDGGAGISYTVGQIDVYLNGVKQLNGTDFTATTGTSVVFTDALATDDVVDIVAMGTFSVADTYTQSAADEKFADLAKLHAYINSF